MRGRRALACVALAAAAAAGAAPADWSFDSRSAQHKRPFGAVPKGSTIDYAVRGPQDAEGVTLVVERRVMLGNQDAIRYEPLARLPMQRGADGLWRASHRFDEVAVHGVWFDIRERGGAALALQNNTVALPSTKEAGSGGAGVAEALPDDLSTIRRFRQSVHVPGFATPAWSQGAVWYYVFPERFRNGDRANDPDPATRRFHDRAIERHARWLETPFKPGDGSDDQFGNDFFGGDLNGLTQQLPMLKALGVTAIYTTPIFLAASNHKYDHANHLRIDPAFGGEPAFRQLVDGARRHGIRLVLDASLNHVGSDSASFDRYLNYAPGGWAHALRSPGLEAGPGAYAGGRVQPTSPYATWFHFRPGDAKQPYEAWYGIDSLPELDKQDAGWRAYAFGHPDSVTRHWLKQGTAGWRMDVAPFVPDDFWRAWRPAVKQTDPDALTIAETWFDPARHLLGDMFDSSMNYVWHGAILDFVNGGSARVAAERIEALRESVPAPALHALMNLVSSHDVPRARFLLGDVPGTAGPAMRELARRRLLFATALQAALPGSPAIYYGDEVGMTGGADPLNRGPYPWPEEGGAPDLELRAAFTRLMHAKRAVPALREGELLAPLLADDDTLVLARRAPGPARDRGWVLLAFHRGAVAREVDITLPAGLSPEGWRTLLHTGGSAPPQIQRHADRLRLRLQPLQAAWWQRR